MDSELLESWGDRSPLLVFDGRCVLCNGFVRFVLAHERDHVLRFATFESELGEDLARRLWRDAQRPESLVLLERGEVLLHAEAVFGVLAHLRAPWRLLRILKVIPRPLRNAVYSAIAVRRYGWFGRTDACLVMTPELRSRVVDGGSG